MIVREATQADLPALLELAREYVAEMGDGWTYDEGISANSLLAYLANPQTAVLVGDESGHLTSGAIVAYDRDFVTQRVGYLIKFYVRKPYRCTEAGRGLAAHCVEWFQQHLCWSAFATCTANIGEDRVFANLFGKFEFSAIGPTLMRNFAWAASQ